jgi:hypothetical protein
LRREVKRKEKEELSSTPSKMTLFIPVWRPPGSRHAAITTMSRITAGNSIRQGTLTPLEIRVRKDETRVMVTMMARS